MKRYEWLFDLVAQTVFPVTATMLSLGAVLTMAGAI